MKEIEHKKTVIRVTEGDPKETADVQQDSTQNKMDKLKKPLIFGLMSIVFLGCIYLIFKPSEDKKKTEHIGLNDAVPEATGTGMQEDKQKAYEQEMLEQKDAEKRGALTTLSDYWNTDDSQKTAGEKMKDEDIYNGKKSEGYGTPALNSYRNTQSELSSFYREDNSETTQLRKQLADLKEKLAEKDMIPKPVTVDDQLALMEKSYQMAAKYLPSGTNQGQPPTSTNSTKTDTVTHRVASNTPKEYFVPFAPTKKNAVSALYREPTNNEFLSTWSESRNRGFYTVGSVEQIVQPKNSVKACIQETQTIIGESGVRIRLLEPAQTANRTIPQGAIVTAIGKFQGGRLQLKVNSIELDGNIIPVDITIYDLDGQQGLYVPYSPEMNALTEMAGNMSQTGGTSIMLTQNAGQQIAADLSRGVVQGISGYFSKKIRTPKVTLKAGYQIFLVSKK
ncbi:conjugative transposon protein TraM [Sphingobacterium sp. Mn56C]|uniref:conjugative transposon protein TraM n=1 Tax=Sphingobacterium sp. Mn56C TaxID=3395261 RepID=UPI003BCE54BA